MLEETAQVRRANWIGAILVGAPALIQLAVIMHHPVAAPSARAGPGAGSLAGLASVVGANRAFHAVLMLLMIAQLTGLALLARRLGTRRPIVIAGAILCALATVLLLLATTFDGFVTFELVTRCASSQEGCTDGTKSSLALVLASIQAFTKLGFLAQCLGFASFALAVLGTGPRTRIIAALGIAAALAPLAAMGAATYVNVAVIVQVLAFHAAWALGAALLLIRDSGQLGGRERPAS